MGKIADPDIYILILSAKLHLLTEAHLTFNNRL